MNERTNIWFIVALAVAVLLSMNSPCFAPKKRTRLPKAIPQSAAFEGEHGKLVSNAYEDFGQTYADYCAQAKRWERIDVSGRLGIVVCGLLSALVLGIWRSDAARKVAICLSIMISAVAAAEQQFQIRAMHEISWRTAVDLERTLTDFSDAWKTKFPSLSPEDRITEAGALISEYKQRVRAVVDREMDVAFPSIEPPTDKQPP